MTKKAGLYIVIMLLSIGVSSAALITINAPPNDDHDDGNPMLWNFTITDADGNNTNCTLYINETANQTELNIANGTTYTESVTLTNGPYNWSLSCTDDVDTTSTATYNLTIDTINPIFTLYSINSDNTSSYLREANSTIWFNDTWEDTYMYAYRQTVYYPNGSVAELWGDEDLTDITVWVNNSVSLAGYPSGTYVYRAEGTDDHTLSEWSMTRRETTGVSKDDLRVVTPENNVITISNLDKDTNELLIKQEKDRLSYTYNTLNNKNYWRFSVSCDGKLVYRGALYPYPSFVCANDLKGNWIDFNVDGAYNFDVSKNERGYEVTYNTRNTDLQVIRSIGGLNYVDVNHTFSIVSNQAPNVTLSWGVSPLYDGFNEIGGVYVDDFEGHNSSISWFWYVNGLSVFNDTTLLALNGSNSYSTLLSGNYTIGDSLFLDVDVFDGYNTTGVNDTIVVSSFSTIILMVQRPFLWFW